MCNTEAFPPLTSGPSHLRNCQQGSLRAFQERPPSPGGLEDPSSPFSETAFGGAAWPEDKGVSETAGSRFGFAKCLTTRPGNGQESAKRATWVSQPASLHPVS